MNHNAYKTTLIFLGIIFVGIILNLFLTEHELVVKNLDSEQAASVNCLEDIENC
jgi:hypothetical protein